MMSMETTTETIEPMPDGSLCFICYRNPARLRTTITKSTINGEPYMSRHQEFMSCEDCAASAATGPTRFIPIRPGIVVEPFAG